MNTTESFQADYLHDAVFSDLVITLFRGPVFEQENPKLWQVLLQQKHHVENYVSVLGLRLLLNERDGHAFLLMRKSSDDDPATMTRQLVARHPLTYQVSLLLVLLRKRLAENDHQGNAERLVLSLDEICDMMRTFLEVGTNEAQFVDKVQSWLTKAVELGLVHKLKKEKNAFEVRSIIKDFIDTQWLNEFEVNLQKYKNHALSLNA